ncbi:YheC/YheD family protein [Paenibacillus gansuensis]|uniref:YheC/YheD family protein n=1 Tax=Paenibacillus gansuensis TaxID=306542 RepID=A0ABW5PFT7_9BACL
MTYSSRSVRSKWTKTKWLRQNRTLRRHIPHTSLFTKSNLDTMLNHYRLVYFKPTGGTGGQRIVRLKKTRQGWQSKYNFTVTTHRDRQMLYRYLRSFSKGNSFLLQKGIRLAKVHGRSFDIRVMMQKTNYGNWINSGLFTKIGHPGKVATNYNQGGTVGTVEAALSGAGFRRAAVRHKKAQLRQLGVAAGKVFSRKHRRFRELGLDVAMTPKGRLWILEVNTRPQYYPLKISHKKIYNRIRDYAKQYGRRS